MAPRRDRDRGHRPDRVLQGIRSQRAAVGVRGGGRRDRRRRTRPRRRRRPGHVHDGPERADRRRPQRRYRRRAVLHQRAVRRRCGRGHRRPGRVGRGRGRRRRRGLLPGVQRTLGRALRRRGPHHRGDAAVDVVVRTVRAAHPGVVGRAARAPVHGPLRRDQRRLRTDRDRRPNARGEQSRCVVPRPAHHVRGPPGVTVDRRARVAPPRLLPGERRRRGAGGDHRRTSPRPAADPGAHQRRRTGLRVRRRHDDGVLPRRPARPPRHPVGGAPALERLRPTPHRHGHRLPLRPLHAVRAHAARGARLLRAR